jgi:inosine-uridine nucleoside N-ribohydrolase
MKLWLRRLAVILLLIVVGLIVTLAIPLPAWRTGRLDVPPFSLFQGGPQVAISNRIWIDTDAACGTTPTTDPDDCLAVAWLAALEVNIVGISTSYGNTEASTVRNTVAALAARLSHDQRPAIPIWHGASGPLSNRTHTDVPAHAALGEALARGPLTILALGPLTNIAAALEDRPELQRNVTRLIAVMGHRPGHIFHPAEGSGQGMLLSHGPIFRDLNFAKDPEAVRSALAMQLPITLVPYDAARTIHITESDLAKLAERGPALAWAAERSRGWLRYWRTDIGRPGFAPFDWVAAAYAVKPESFNCAKADVWIAREWALWLVPRPSLLVGPRGAREPETKREVIYCPQVDPSLHDYLLGRTGP